MVKCFVIIAALFLLAWPAGDVNFDGKLNSTDLNMIWKGNLNPAQRIVADVNRDGLVNQKDLDILFDMILMR